jgi:hypothetical protein
MPRNTACGWISKHATTGNRRTPDHRCQNHVLSILAYCATHLCIRRACSMVYSLHNHEWGFHGPGSIVHQGIG